MIDASALAAHCCRQSGKSTVVAILSLISAMWFPMTHVVIVSR
ncbi:MAG TPA: hypothetical protein VFE62_18995 [Gemmataceae bacterium]|nr:hypothetical protein [Gemmataceae bacterium]